MQRREESGSREVDFVEVGVGGEVIGVHMKLPECLYESLRSICMS